VYFSLAFYPQLDSELYRAIGKIREQHDPTSRFIRPHMTVVFPVPGSLGEGNLSDHIQCVLAGWKPFEIRFGCFHRSCDHWLFLTLVEGEAKVRQLYRGLYTGILRSYRREDIEFIPHLGLGLFLKEGAIYDWNNPQESSLDEKRYNDALREAETLRFTSPLLVERLALARVPDEVIEWAEGKRPGIPDDAAIEEVREFFLGREGG
jgi:2'-5' RNA ligase